MCPGDAYWGHFAAKSAEISTNGSTRSESGASGQQSHNWTANHCRSDGSQMMRSIGRVEAPRWLSDESLKAAGARTSKPIEIFWGNPMPGTANGRGPGKRGCIMISVRLALGRLEDRPLPSRVCPHETPDILGIDLNCSELRLFTPACGAPHTDVGGPWAPCRETKRDWNSVS